MISFFKKNDIINYGIEVKPPRYRGGVALFNRELHGDFEHSGSIQDRIFQGMPLQSRPTERVLERYFDPFLVPRNEHDELSTVRERAERCVPAVISNIYGMKPAELFRPADEILTGPEVCPFGWWWVLAHTGGYSATRHRKFVVYGIHRINDLDCPHLFRSQCNSFAYRFTA